MGFGVLEDLQMEHVPGTVTVLNEHSSSSGHTALNPRLKYDTSGSVPVILVPQPSDDPNDPLIWPLWKRDAILVVLSIVSVMAAALSPLLAANTLTLSLFLERDFTAVALLTGYHLCGVGVAGIFFVASARVWEKRHLYLLGTVLLIGASAWGGASRSYKSLLWARIIQGVGVAPFEAFVNASVGDLYFVHQRGIRMALSNLALFGSAFFTPIVKPPFADPTISTRTLALLTAIGGSSTFETGHELSTSHLTPKDASPPQDFGQTAEKPLNAGSYPLNVRNDRGAVPPKASFTSKLSPFNGRKTDDTFFKLLLRPFPLFLHPAILWGCLIQGTMIGWTVLIGVVLAAIFLGPPLYFDEQKTGYMYSGAFIGAILGFVVSGLLADWSARFMTRRNGGIYEPEFRIVLVVPQLVFGCAGLYGFGITGADVTRYGWFWPDFFMALVVMGMVVGAVASALYLVDAHRDISIESFTCLLMFKNMFSFALTWSAYGWIVQTGIVRTFNVIASIQVVVCLLSIPMFIFGKRNRSFFHRHDIFMLVGLQ